MQMREKMKMHLKRFDELKSARSNLEAVWQDVDDLFGGGEGITRHRLPGEEKVVLSDSTPEQAMLSYTRFLGDVTRKRGTQWIRAEFDQKDLDQIQELAEYKDIIDERMIGAINRPEGRFAENAWKADVSLAKYAIAFMFEDENVTAGHLRFRTFPVRDCYLDEDEHGNPDCVFRKFEYNARQAVHRWGEDKVHPKVKKAYDDNDAKKFTFLHLTIPNEDRKLYGFDAILDRPYLTSYLDVENEHYQEEAGYYENPWITPRQNVISGMLYGYSMAMSALPDSRMLQFVSDALMDATEYQLRPPLMTYSDNTVRLGPDEINRYDPSTLNNRPPIEPIDMGGNIPVGLDLMVRRQDQLMKFFLEDVFSLPDRSNMTAAEIQRRNDDLARIIGPMTDTLLPDYNGAIAKRTFGIMNRREQFIFEGKDYSDIAGNIKFEYENPIERLQKETDKAFIEETLQFTAETAERTGRPELLDNLDWDAITRDYGAMNIRAKYIRSEEDVRQIRQDRAEQQAAMQAMQEATMVSEAGANIAENLQVIEGGLAG